MTFRIENGSLFSDNRDMGRILTYYVIYPDFSWDMFTNDNLFNHDIYRDLPGDKYCSVAIGVCPVVLDDLVGLIDKGLILPLLSLSK